MASISTIAGDLRGRSDHAGARAVVSGIFVSPEFDHGFSSRLPARKRAVGPLRLATVESAIT